MRKLTLESFKRQRAEGILNFADTDLSGLDFRGVDVSNCLFWGCNLRDCIFDQRPDGGPSFDEAEDRFEGAKMKGVTFQSPNFGQPDAEEPARGKGKKAAPEAPETATSEPEASEAEPNTSEEPESQETPVVEPEPTPAEPAKWGGSEPATEPESELPIGPFSQPDPQGTNEGMPWEEPENDVAPEPEDRKYEPIDEAY